MGERTSALLVALALVVLTAPGIDARPEASIHPSPASRETPVQRSRRGAEPLPLPSIVLILLDDMRREELAFMPTVRSAIVRRGVTFTNAFVVNPTCCPSRASILTGQYSHTTRVYTNDRLRLGGWPAFRPHENDTIATRLTDRYETALVGKYLNAYKGKDAESIPVGWDEWVAFADTRGARGAYERYSLLVAGPNGRVRTERYGAGVGPRTYSTDVLADAAVSIIRHNQRDSEPLFLLYAPFAPHGPAIPLAGMPRRP